jgi:alcohol dehydrogenase/L-iditol 2-dehydrogenase
VVKPGYTVLVLGPGPIGLLCLLLAGLHGAGTTIVAGLTSDSPRLDLARSLGATHAVDLQQDDLMELIHGVGDGFGADVVIDAAGVAASFHTAMEAVRPLGQIAKVGWGPGPVGVSLDPIVQKSVTVNGSFSHNYRTWERVISLLSSCQIDVSPLVGLYAPLDNWKEGFDSMHDGRIPKAVLQP